MKEVLHKLDFILDKNSSLNPQSQLLFQSLRNSYFRWGNLSLKQKGLINIEYRKLSTSAKDSVFCSVQGIINKGCMETMYCAYQIKKDKKILAEDSISIPPDQNNTYNTANYVGLLMCLDKLEELGLNKEKIKLVTQCYALVEEMNKIWKVTPVNEGFRKPIKKRVKQNFKALKIFYTEKEFNLIFKYDFSQIKAA